MADGNGRTLGRLFERLIMSFLRTDPLYDRFDEVWMWDDYPGRNDRSDFGVDLVARQRDGSLCAIQCKFFNDRSLTKRDVDSFLEAGSRMEFQHMMLVYAAKGYGKKVGDALKGHRCRVLDFESLASSPLDWPDLAADMTTVERVEPYALRDYQEDAVAAVTANLDDRGQMIMACGTGKTLTSLRIAEQMVGKGGLVLYAVPSISLMRQTIRYWAEQKLVPHSYVGVCSDSKVSHGEKVDTPLHEMEIPVTTNPERISSRLEPDPDLMTVVFSTYQSMDAVIRAQKRAGASFDLVLCDEAHRTTGAEVAGSSGSFLSVHHDLKAANRLYMTATPKVYGGAVKAKAGNLGIPLYSMDDVSRFGPELYRLDFSDAIDKNLLSDYRVIVLGIDESYAQGVLQNLVDTTSDGGDLNLTDAARMLGLYRVLQEPDQANAGRYLKTAIAYTNRVASSKALAKHIMQLAQNADADSAFRCEADHVDGTQNASRRARALQWLRERGDGCRILSNAKCLSEGVDVPSLDAVAFMNPKSSQVDIIQAVGRVMRKHDSKRYGYVIIPIGIPPDQSAESILDNNDVFGLVWGVLRALRSHDTGLDIETNTADLRRALPRKVKLYGVGPDGKLREPSPRKTYPVGDLDVPADALYSKIVEKVGDRLYMEHWAKDVAQMVERLQVRIRDVITRNAEASAQFESFMRGLRDMINDSLADSDGIDMLSQHMVTHRIFNALFGEEFKNPVSEALESTVLQLRWHGLDAELKDLESFYTSIENRVSGLKDRQPVISELYGKFFKIAFPKLADRLGIVYTPEEVVDFILMSVDQVLRDNFDKGLTDDVRVIDPFTGAGTFLSRMMQLDLIADQDVDRKYRAELFANEIVLLAYYIAAVNCESAYAGRTGRLAEFENISLTDTFNLDTMSDWTGDLMAAPKRSIRRQREAKITGVVGNPPYSAGQKTANDDNKNTRHRLLEQRVRDTYVKRAPKGNKVALYNTYIKALRWASDRIGESGVIGFITPSSYLTGNAEAGVRVCLCEEFTDVWCFDLRGNALTSGEQRRREGGNVFGIGSKTPISITILVKNPMKKGCTIHYKAVPYYLTRKQKLEIVRTARLSDDWDVVIPDKHNDWLNQRGEVGERFEKYVPMGSKDGKSGKVDNVLFRKYSRGLATSRDDWAYNTSKAELENNMRRHIDYCNSQDLDNFIIDPTQAKKNSSVIERMKKLGKKVYFDRHKIRIALYRPFFKQYLYFDPVFVHEPTVVPPFFPVGDADNLAILVPDKASRFSSIITNATPDLNNLAPNQCFPFRTKYTSRKLAAARHPQSAIRNPQSAIRNPQSAIRNPQSRIWR